MQANIFFAFATFAATLVCGVVSVGNLVDYQVCSDQNQQKQFIRRHLPQFLPANVADNLVRATKVRKYEEYVDGVRSISDIYRQNFTLSEVTAKLRSNSIADSTCLTLILKTRTDLALGLPYAAYMDDSNGREESGLLKGNTMWVGRYYECMGQTDGGDITAKMCLVTSGPDPSGSIGISSGQCVPDVCEEEELSEIFESLFLPSEQFASVQCPKEIPYGALDIVTILIFSLLVMLVIVGTIWEAALLNSDSSKSAERAKIPAALNILLCFSAIRNNHFLFNTKRKESSIPVLDGIRFLSMTWVVQGNMLSIAYGVTDNAVDVGTYYFSHIGFQALANGTLSVDSFFFLSGLLVTYLALREMRAKGGKLNVPLMYLKRYLRLTPALILIMLFAMTIFQRIGGGLTYQYKAGYYNSKCREYWWTNLLYINNLYYTETFGRGCLAWLWYLANDMQFFLLSPIFLYLLYNRPKTGLIVMSCCVVTSAAITGALTRYYEIVTDVYGYAVQFRYLQLVSLAATNVSSPTFGSSTTNGSNETPDEPDVYWDDVYTKPWCRIGVYLIGMATGYILYATNKKIKMNKIFVALLWVLVAAVELAIVYGWWGPINSFNPNDPPTYNVMAFYEAVRRPLWGFGLMWLTIACTSGYGGPINAILGWRVFLPLGRLTFATYMFHCFVIVFIFASWEVEPHLRVDTYIYYSLATLLLSMFGGYLLFLMIEAPVAGMQKLMFSKYRSKPSGVSVNVGIELEKKVVEDEKGDQSTAVKVARIGYENQVEYDDELKLTKEKEFTERL